MDGQMLAWPLFGAGMDKLGCSGAPCQVKIPGIGDDQLLVRIDAIGLCFSDVKLIRAGEEHPRVISADLAADPVIPGHEAVMTVKEVGSKLKDKFKIGQRFIIQADIYVNGKGFAYGYAINGGMAQYSVIDQRVLNGDEGCYLLPVGDDMPSAVAALLEPWTCVQASYMIDNRSKPKAGAEVLAVAGDKQTYVAGALLKAAGIKSIALCNFAPEAAAALEKELGITAEKLSGLPLGRKFDEIFCCNVGREVGESAAKLGKKEMVCSFIGDYKDENWSFDVGSIHYEGWFYQGAAGNDLSAAYGRNVRSTLKKGGVCYLPGGAGAMGQMHTQMAAENPDGPRKILVTDMDDSRIENVRRQLAAKIAERNIEFKAVNPAKMKPEEFAAIVREFAPDGFDDIIMLVPVPGVLEEAANYLKNDGVMNIFAGIPAGKEAKMNIRAIADKGVRYIGSSGSRTEHLRHTLQLAIDGKLNPATALAAVGGMKVLKEGLEAVIAAKYPGKTVIFPNAPDLPLLSVGELAALDGDFAAAMGEEKIYNMAAEKLIQKKYQTGI